MSSMSSMSSISSMNCFMKQMNSFRCLQTINVNKCHQKCLYLEPVLRPLRHRLHENSIHLSFIRPKVSLNNNNFIQFQCLSNDCQLSQNCWKCSQSLNHSNVVIFCPKCHSIQSLDWGLNYFELFSQNVSFDINLIDLNKTFKSLQMSTHPDKYVTASEREHNYSIANSTLINKAYKTLLSPFERGVYLLNLFDHNIDESDTGIDSQFLMTIMDLNETIETNDKSLHKLILIFKDNEQNMRKSMQEISNAFKSHDIFDAKQLLMKFKFYITLNSNLKQKIEKLT